jgi:hypothetical protein
MADKTTEFKTDTTVLGRYYSFATDAEIETAVKELQLELTVRENRREVGRLAKARSAERAAEVRELIDSINDTPAEAL